MKGQCRGKVLHKWMSSIDHTLLRKLISAVMNLQNNVVWLFNNKSTVQLWQRDAIDHVQNACEYRRTKEATTIFWVYFGCFCCLFLICSISSHILRKQIHHCVAAFGAENSCSRSRLRFHSKWHRTCAVWQQQPQQSAFCQTQTSKICVWRLL